MASKKNLSTKMRHSIFIREYARHGNGLKAAITAGYSLTRAKVTACELLARPEIRQAIEVKIRSRQKRLDLSADRVANELYMIAMSRITDLGEIIDGEFQPWDSAELEDTDIAAIAEISQITRESPDGTKTTKLKLKMYNRLEALKEFNRMFCLTTDMNSLISGLRAYGLNIVKDAQERWHLIDERLPPSERLPLNMGNMLEAEADAEAILLEEEE